MRVFLLAGGFATRLWPLTERRAKPLLPLAGKPIIDHLLAQLPVTLPVTVSTNAAFADSFEEWRKENSHPNVHILVERARQEGQKLGALGAVAQWVTQENITEDVLLLTGDNYCGFPIADFLGYAVPDVPLIAAHNIGDLEQAKHFGTIVPAEDSLHVQSFEEKPASPRSTLISTGCSVIPGCLLPLLVEYAHFKPDNVGGIFEECLARGIPVQFRAYSEPWFDIGSFEAYLQATKTLVGDRLLKTDDCIVERSTTEETVVLGRGARVCDSVLRNVILFRDCTVEDCILENCILDDRCTLRGIDLTGKMLREGTDLRK